MSWLCWREESEVLSAVKRLAVVLALAFHLAVLGCADAEAKSLALRAQEMNGFGRIALEFDQPTKLKTKTSNGILVLTFADPVTIKGERLVREAPGYVAQVRRDPDGMGIRLALTQPFRVNVLEAGEKVFVDLLPANWAGLPPGLPPEIVEALARRAREAEAKARQEERRRTELWVGLKVVQLPTLTRLMFEVPATVPVSFRSGGTNAELEVERLARLDVGDGRERLGPAVRAIEAEPSAATLKVKLALAEGYEAKGFRDEDAYIVDIAKPRSAPEPAAAAKAGPSRPDPRSLPREAAKAEPTRPAANEGPIQDGPAEKPPEPPAASKPAQLSRQPDAGPVRASAAATDEGLSIAFPFRAKTAAAAFERGGIVTGVFHSASPIDLPALPASAGPFASLKSVSREGAFSVVRLTLTRGHFVRLAPQGEGWVLSVGQTGLVPSQPIAAQRSSDRSGRTVVSIPLSNPSGVHWIQAAEGEERIAVATAYGPPQAVPKQQQFVEFRLLASAHGVAVAVDADDVLVHSGIDGVTVARQSGLAVSLPDPGSSRSRESAGPVIDRERWAADRAGSPVARRNDLMNAVAASPRSGRSAARLELARFLMANGLNTEAVGVLSTAAKEDQTLLRQREFLLLDGIGLAGMRRDAEARRAFANEAIAEDAEAGLWRAFLDARAGQWSAALVGFRRLGPTLDFYPDEIQVPFRVAAARAAVEMKDAGYAEAQLAAAGQRTTEPRASDEIALLRARLDEAGGRGDIALDTYRKLADDADQPIAAEAGLAWVSLGLRERAITPDAAVPHLERLAIAWRGGDTEIRTLDRLGRLYAEAGRWRESFTVARRANRAFPDHEVTRALYDDTARLFEDLFLSGKGDTLSRVDSLALYFDFKEFTPIGRRGDELVRRLADRLVELDLLAQAGDLLQHQVDSRLTGAARATIAARLATVRLMDGKPQQALQAIQSTRLPELPASTKRARMLLEARALSDLSRTDLALEVLQAESGPEIDRLRADIQWSGRRWREAGEAHERLLGTRWQGAEPFSERERTDVLRAAIAYSLGDEALALDRLRSKFAAKMADSSDARTFGFLTQPNVASTRAFRDAARGATSADTLADFLAEYRKRYPETAAPARRGEGGGPVPEDRPEPRPQAQASTPARS